MNEERGFKFNDNVNNNENDNYVYSLKFKVIYFPQISQKAQKSCKDDLKVLTDVASAKRSQNFGSIKRLDKVKFYVCIQKP